MKGVPAFIESDTVRPLRTRRGRWLSGAAIGAILWLSVTADPASAQAINGAPSTQFGVVNYSRFSNPTPGVETITINTQSAIIHWDPGVAPFLPAANTVTFQGVFANYAVLNRILTNTPSRFDGTLLSRIFFPNTGTSIPGGTVLFSSPGGIIVGSTARFDVGNLVLTSLNVVSDPSTGNFFTPAGGFHFVAVGGAPSGPVITEPGAQIVASPQGSYIALVAPRVVHGGTIDVNGSSAFIAAQEVEFSVNQGLFDIVVTTGTDDPNPILHTGVTGGPASTGAGDNHNIYAVAVSRNQIATMLLQGSIGYDPAVSAFFENGAIVLSAGHNIQGGNIAGVSVPAAPPTNIAMSDGTFSSDVRAQSTGETTGSATTADPLAFEGSLDVRVDNGTAFLTAGDGASVTVAENLTINADSIDIDTTTVGIDIALTAVGSVADAAGTIDIGSATAGGDITLDAIDTIDVGSAQAGDDFQSRSDGAFTGGIVVTTGLGRDNEENGSNIVVTADDDVRLDNGDSADGTRLSSTGGNVFSSTLLDAGADILVSANTDITVVDATAGGFVGLVATNNIVAQDLMAGGSIQASSGNDTTIARADAGQDVILNAGADIGVTIANAGDDFQATAGGTFTSGNISTSGLGSDIADTGTPLEGSNILVDADGDLRLDNASAPGRIALASVNGNVLSNGLLDAGGDIVITADPDIDVNDLDAGGAINLTAEIDIDGGAFNAGGSIATDAGGDTVIVSATSTTGSILVHADGIVNLGTLLADDDIIVDPISVVIGSAVAGGDIDVTATTFITVGSADAGDDFTAVAGTTFDAGTLIARGVRDSEGGIGPLAGGNIFVDTSGDLRVDNGDARDDIRLTAKVGSVLSAVLLDAGSDINILAGTDILLTNLTAGSDINLDAARDAALTSAQAGDDFGAGAGGTFNAGSVTTTGLAVDTEAGAGAFGGSSIVVNTTGDLRLDNGDAASAIRLSSSTGGVFSSTLLDAGTDLVAFAGGNVDLADGTAGGIIDLLAIGSIDAAQLTAGASITINSNGDTTIAGADSGDAIDITAGGSAGLGTLVATNAITVTGNAITVASATSGTDIFLLSANDVTIGSAQAGDDFTAFAGAGSFTGTNVVATGLGVDNELNGGNIVVNAQLDLRLDNGTASDGIVLQSFAGSILSSGTLRADSLVATASLNLDLNDVFVVNQLNLQAPGGFIDGNRFESDSDINLDAAQSVTLANADSGGTIAVNAGTAANLGTFVAATDIIVNASSIDFVSATAGDDIVANAGLDLAIADADAADSINLFAGGAIDAGSLTTTSGPIFTSSSGNTAIDAASSGASLTTLAGGSLDLGTVSAAIDIAASANNGIDITSATAGRDISLGGLGDFVVGFAQAGDDFFSTGDGAFNAGTIVVTGLATDNDGAGILLGHNISVTASGNLRLDNGTAPDRIQLLSGGSIFSAGTLDANALTADAALDLALNDVIVVADLSLTTVNGDISGNSFSSAGNISLDASGDVDLAAADSSGAILIDAGGGADLGDLDAVGDITIDAATILLANAGSGRDIVLDSAGNIDVGAATAVGNFTALGRANGEFTTLNAASVAIDLTGNARFDGAVTAPAIAVISSDIDVAGTAALGNAATQTVSLTARATGLRTVLGGSTQGPGYTLTDGEADRITAATLRIDASPTGTAASRPADVLVRDLSLAGNRIGRLDLRTTGIVQVDGNLLLAGVRPGGGIEIRATEGLMVVNPTGSIRVRDAAGLTDGDMLLVSNNIWSASQAILDQLRVDSNFAGRDAALTNNDGPVEPRGYIEAGDVVLSARDSLFTQNSGTLASLAGITVRENTLRLVPTGIAPLRVFAFGSRINPDGSFVTNFAFFNEVDYQGRGGPVGYTDDAQFNLCFINTGICRFPGGDNQLPGGPEIIEEPVGDGFELIMPGATDDLVDTSFADEPLIEEPVTSGGDSILWDCDNDDDGDCDEDDFNG